MGEVLQIGERATNMARIFNLREGFSRKDDTLPERLFQPLENGALEGHAMPREEFEQALTHLYQLKGWDPCKWASYQRTAGRIVPGLGSQICSNKLETMKLYLGSYFAFFTPDRRHWVDMELRKPTRLVDIVSKIGIPIAEIYLVVLNDRLVESPNTIVSNDDIVRLYPAIGGG